MNRSLFKNKKCPDCGSETRSYHGQDYSRQVCREKCKGEWHVIEKVDRFKAMFGEEE